MKGYQVNHLVRKSRGGGGFSIYVIFGTDMLMFEYNRLNMVYFFTFLIRQVKPYGCHQFCTGRENIKPASEEIECK